MPHILITGGSGMVGAHLREFLVERGFEVAILSRSKREIINTKVFTWDIASGFIEDGAIEGASHIVHLAGAGVVDKRWSTARKKELYDSRVMSTRLLARELANRDHDVKAFISSSAIGYYGNTGDQMMKEDAPPGKNFLAQICTDWERESEGIATPRRVVIRIGIILMREGGALHELEKSTKFGLGAYLGTGQQYYSWIHMDDLIRLIHFIIDDDSIEGIYNAVAPEPVTNKELVHEIMHASHHKGLMAPVPEFVLRLIMGEMAAVVLETQRVSAEKTLSTGFEFEFNRIDDALADIYK